jgi:hypothetical protein
VSNAMKLRCMDQNRLEMTCDRTWKDLTGMLRDTEIAR